MNVSYPVQLIPQTTAANCWRAALAMVLGRPMSDVSHGQGHLRIGGGLRTASESIERFSESNGLIVEQGFSWSVQGIFELLESYGPLWVGGDMPEEHAVCVGGLRSESSDPNAYVRIYDPSPIEWGEIRTENYQDFMTRWPLATNWVLHLPSRWQWMPAPDPWARHLTLAVERRIP